MDARLRLRPAPRGGRGRFVLAGVAWLGMAGVLTGCSQPAPDTYYDFLHDKISREAALARCDRAGAVSVRDLGCANARRAELMIELRRERARQAQYHEESERKIAALEARIAARRQAEEADAAAAKAAAERAYDRRWNDRADGPAALAPAAGSGAQLPRPAVSVADGAAPVANGPQASVATQPTQPAHTAVPADTPPSSAGAR